MSTKPKPKMLDSRDVRAAVFRFTLFVDELMTEIDRQRAVRLLEENGAEEDRLLKEVEESGPSKTMAELALWRTRMDKLDQLSKEHARLLEAAYPRDLT